MGLHIVINVAMVAVSVAAGIVMSSVIVDAAAVIVTLLLEIIVT